MGYPRWVYTAREEVTRENMRLYDKRQEQINKKCVEINPDYYKLGLRERHAIREKAKALV